MDRRSSPPAVWPVLRRSVLLPVLLVGTGGCHGATYSASSGMWVRLGDASLVENPGRAVADYDKAKAAHEREQRNRDPSEVSAAAIDRKRKDAATRWLLAGIAAQKPPTTESEARKTLGYVSATRALGDQYEVKDRIAAPLASLETTAYQKFWDARRSAPSHSPFEKLSSLVDAQKALPSSAREMSRGAGAEIARQRTALIAKYTRDVEAASGHPGARYLRRKLLEAAKQTPGTFAKTEPPAEVARAGRIAWKTTIGETNCDGIGGAFTPLRTAKDGDHRGSLRLTATCSVEERTGADARSLAVRISGALNVTLDDGTETAVPIDLSEIVDAKAVKDQQEALERVYAGALATGIARVVDQQARAVTLWHLATAQAMLDAGDALSAEDHLAIAAANDATARDVPSGLAPLATTSELPFNAWLSVVIDDHQPFTPSSAIIDDANAGPSRPSPDAVGLWIEKKEGDRIRGEHEEKTEHHHADGTRLGGGIGLAHWDTFGSKAAAGPAAHLFFSGGEGEGVAFFFHDSTAKLESTFGAGTGFGLDVLLRLGGGVRTRWGSLAPYVVGGASGRGTPSSSLYVPLGLDLGIGTKIAVRVAKDMRIEVAGERVSRPMREAGGAPRPIVQRMTYGLRWISTTASDLELGGSLACSFYQESAAGIVFPAANLRGRSCEAAVFMSF